MKLHIETRPVPKGRPRMGKWGAYTPAKTRKFEALIKEEASKRMFVNPIKDPINVHIEFIMRKAKTNKKYYPTQRPDLDNLQKGVLDALNKVVYEDDCQIINLSSMKRFGSPESITITVWRVE